MLSTIGLLVILSAGPTACPFGGAVYEARADRAWRLEVSDGTGRAMIRVRSAVTGAEYAFEISEGEGYPTATLASSLPGADVAAIPIYALTEDMDWLGESRGLTIRHPGISPHRSLERRCGTGRKRWAARRWPRGSGKPCRGPFSS